MGQEGRRPRKAREREELQVSEHCKEAPTEYKMVTGGRVGLGMWHNGLGDGLPCTFEHLSCPFHCLPTPFCLLPVAVVSTPFFHFLLTFPTLWFPFAHIAIMISIITISISQPFPQNTFVSGLAMTSKFLSLSSGTRWNGEFENSQDICENEDRCQFPLPEGRKGRKWWQKGWDREECLISNGTNNACNRDNRMECLDTTGH